MNTETQKVDVLEVIKGAIKRTSPTSHFNERANLWATHDAVAELIEAAKLVNADHAAPHDCYATGPLTGDRYLDLIRCPGCQLAAALARVGGDL